jgi:hypothetical protein
MFKLVMNVSIRICLLEYIGLAEFLLSVSVAAFVN